MKTTVIVLFILGTLINLLKGADLLLRPHQKRRIQIEAEKVTLWAEYTRPIEWYTKSLSKAQRILISIIATLAIAQLCVGTASAEHKMRVIVPILLMAGIFTTLLLLIMPDFKGNKWLFRARRSELSHKNKTLLIGAITYWLLLISVLWFAENRSGDSHSIISFIGLAVTLTVASVVIPLYVLFVDFFLVVVMLMLFYCPILLLEYALKLLRAISWRIVEYDKGAYAALTLITTVILGIVLGIINAK